MADRKRLVQSKSFFYYVCDVHGWEYDPSEQEDCCPVCQGEQAERKRIKEIIEQQAFIMGKHIMRAETVPFAASMNT
jgi:predicted  nucleic acid-binding Zn ribbon protein